MAASIAHGVKAHWRGYTRYLVLSEVLVLTTAQGGKARTGPSWHAYGLCLMLLTILMVAASVQIAGDDVLDHISDACLEMAFTLFFLILHDEASACCGRRLSGWSGLPFFRLSSLSMVRRGFLACQHSVHAWRTYYACFGVESFLVGWQTAE